MNNFYVYQLIDPRNNHPFYIGKGVGSRMYFHERTVRTGKVPNGNNYLFNKIKKILAMGHCIGYAKIIENVSESTAFECEVSLIKKYGIRPYGILCNLSYGGEGNSGYKWTPEQVLKMKCRISELVKTELWRKHYLEGRKRVDWNAVRIKQAKTLKNRFQTDPKFLEEHRARIKNANSSPEVVAANAERTLRFYQEHPEQKEKLSSIQKQLWASGKYDNSKKWKFKSPSGELAEFSNLAKFCRDNNLTSANMMAVSSGRRKHHKGWTIT